MLTAVRLFQQHISYLGTIVDDFEDRYNIPRIMRMATAPRVYPFRSSYAILFRESLDGIGWF